MEDVKAFHDVVDDDDAQEVDMIPDAPRLGLTFEDSVFSVAMMPSEGDLQVAAVGVGDDHAYLVDLEDGTVLNILEGHTDSVIDVGFNHTGRLLATAGMDGTVRIWSTELGNLERVLDGPASELHFASWHPKGDVLLAGSGDTTAWMWDAATGSCLQVFAGHLGAVTCGQFDNRTGKLAVTGSDDGSCIVWDPKSGSMRYHLKGDAFHHGPITCIDTNASHPLLVSASECGRIRLSNLKSGKLIAPLFETAFSASVEAAVMTPKGAQWEAVAAGDASGAIWVADTSSGKTRVGAQMEDGVVRLRWDPQGSPLLFACGLDHAMRVLDGRTGDTVRTWKDHQHSVLDFCLDSSLGYPTILTAGDDGMAYVYDLRQ